MKIKTNTTIKDLKGVTLKNEDGEVTLGEVLSNVLLADKSGGKMKMFVLAEKLFKSKEIELDDADFSLIKGSVEKSEIYGNLVLGQTLLILEGIKKEGDKK